MFKPEARQSERRRSRAKGLHFEANTRRKLAENEANVASAGKPSKARKCPQFKPFPAPRASSGASLPPNSEFSKRAIRDHPRPFAAKRTFVLLSPLFVIMTNRRRALLWVGAAVSASGIAVCLSGAVLFEIAVRVPRRTAHLTESATRELHRLSASWDSVTVKASDRAVLRAWFLQPRTPASGCAMLLHGIADSRQSGAGFASMLLTSGYSVLLPDSRAHGESGGEQVTFGVLEKEDVAAWASWLQAHGCRDLYALGESMGAGVVLQAAGSGVPFRAVVAECPSSSFVRIAEYRLAAQLPYRESSRHRWSGFCCRPPSSMDASAMGSTWGKRPRKWRSAIPLFLSC